jgi:hypothetical protein
MLNNFYNISNIIDKDNYLNFLKNKKNITECQYKLIKNSYLNKINKKNNYPKTTNNLLEKYINIDINLNNSYTRLLILLNYYYSYNTSNNIIKNIIKNKKVKDTVIIQQKEKNSIVINNKICDLHKNLIFYIFEGYKTLEKNFQENNNKNILYITHKLSFNDHIYINQLKKKFKNEINSFDVYDLKDLKLYMINENKYDIIFLSHEFVKMIEINKLFTNISNILKENGILFVFGFDIFTEEDQYIKLLMNKIEFSNLDIELCYPLNLFELEYILSTYHFLLYNSNDFFKTYGQIPKFIQSYYGIFINRKI